MTAQAGASRQGIIAEPAALQEPAVVSPVGTEVRTKLKAVVTYQRGQLTIDAEDATLRAVLELVAAKTGAVIEVPSGSGLERIVEHVGPGQANEVLTQLLSGSHFNFVIVSSPQHPNQPTQVLLSLQAKEVESTASLPPREVDAPPDSVAGIPLSLPQIQDGTLTPPDGPLTPEARGELMKEKARELREKAQQQ